MSGRPRKIWSIEGNAQRLDGGAMFGNAPKALWQRWIAADEHNRIPLACRAMLVREESDRLILFETGIGAFFPPALRQRFGVLEPSHALLENLEAVGVSDADVDVVVLSHLHFDHAGGLLEVYREDEQMSLRFPQASFVVGAGAWKRARSPHRRDRASFIEELPALLEASGRLEIVEGERSETLGDGYRLHRSDGHTPGLMATEIESEQGPVLFCADLIPGAPWVHLPITMGYDRFPELLVEEKRQQLEALLEVGGRLFFTHDPEVALGRVSRDERGRFTVVDRVASVEALEI